EHRRGILPPAHLPGGDGPLAQALEDQVVEVAVLGELHRGIDPVARESCARTQADRPAAHTHPGMTPITTAARTMTMLTSHTHRNEWRMCRPMSTLASPTSRKNDPIIGLIGNPAVSCPRIEACAMCIPSTPNWAPTAMSTGMTPK